MRNTHRRVVTGNVNGKSVVQSDERLPAYAFETVNGYEHTLFWANPATPDLNTKQKFDSYPDSVVPGPGGTSLHLVTFPPGVVFSDPSFDSEAARKESLGRLPGLDGPRLAGAVRDHDRSLRRAACRLPVDASRGLRCDPRNGPTDRRCIIDRLLRR